MAADKFICNCDSAKGSDTCKPLGSCALQPCKACEACVQAMQLFPAIVKDVFKSDAVAAQFQSFCVGSGRNYLACTTAAAAIADSTGGNLGRRPAAICRALAECSTTLGSCNVSAVAGAAAQPLDLCTTTGVASGAGVDGVWPVGQAPIGACLADASCTGQGMFCSMASPRRACSCQSGSGADSCVAMGSCQLTPCKQCGDCIASLASYVAGVPAGANSTDIAEAFRVQCIGNGSATPECTLTAAYIAAGRSNSGRRAGALCSMMGECGVTRRLCGRLKCGTSDRLHMNDGLAWWSLPW